MKRIKYLDKLSRKLRKVNSKYAKLAQSGIPKPIPGVNLPWSRSSPTDLLQLKRYQQEALFREFILLSTGPFVYDYLRLKSIKNKTLEDQEHFDKATETLLNIYMGNVSALDYLEKVINGPWIGLDIVAVHEDLLMVQSQVNRMKKALI
ncbi:hypothetical protein [Cyclobacterium marinum]|uniref:hypothetical protein n=1 Tax=Cyclobacterium marinum TaxID=104 RepID=UPI0030D8CBD7